MVETFGKSGNKENKKFARVTSLIRTKDQEYVDPRKRYAHNDLYASTVVEIIRIEDDGRVLLKDNTGEFWVPNGKLEML